MIQITLVRVGDVLVGRTVSDRFNLQQFGVTSVTCDRNHAAVKRLRRALAREGFTLRVLPAKTGVVKWAATPIEREALGVVRAVPFTRAA